MKTTLLALGLLFSVMLAQAGDFQTNNPAEFHQLIPDGAKLRKIVGGLQFAEGPVWIPRPGNYLVFSDIPANELKKWDPNEGFSVFRAPSHNANGNTLDLKGRLITCEHSSRRVSIKEWSGQVRTLVDHYENKKFNSPNDVAVKSDGTIWFTDPPYGVKPADKELPGNYVYRFDPKAQSIKAVALDFDCPNGICFSPDEKKLYIADSGKPHHIRVFSVQQNGILEGGRVFCVIDNGLPDGIRCDADGRVWSSAGDGVQIFSPTGQLIGKIFVPESPSNLCFGGKQFKTLFITARSSVYAIDLKVQGAQH